VHDWSGLGLGVSITLTCSSCSYKLGSALHDHEGVRSDGALISSRLLSTTRGVKERTLMELVWMFYFGSLDQSRPNQAARVSWFKVEVIHGPTLAG